MEETEAKVKEEIRKKDAQTLTIDRIELEMRDEKCQRTAR
jgi:hypothetical protein